ncbi:Xenobiotic-transporting ATPase [Syntrophobotulus glycolicus DSM 8271]|uniref:Xenobiotic-transporting ATPase n=2 Tax=Syntrophobotulus TaxID=51196 RepID=F0STQ6_SYNGF|nr:Xenobiotic-transporting ATPase [Syntrophobotulus glycolicus DSM 8271]
MKFMRNKARSIPNTAGSVNSLRELLKISSPQKSKLLLACVCVVIVNTAVIYKPIILKFVIDDLFIGQKAQTGFYSLTSIGIIYLLVSLTGSLFGYIQVNVINAAGQQMIKALRERVFQTIQLLPLHYLDKTSSGRLITRATNDISEISDMYTDVLMNLFNDIFLLTGILYAMIHLNLELALVALAVIPPMAALVTVIKNKVRRNFFTVKHIIGKINSFMAENISGMKIIQIFNAEKEKEQEFKKLNQEYFQSTMIQVRLNSFLRPASEVFQSLSVAILIWYGMGQISNHHIQIGLLYAFTTYVKQFFNPIADLSERYTSIQSALVSTERIFDLLNRKDILEDLDSGIPMDEIKGDIEFKNVWFSYDNENWILKDVSFKISPGQSVAFVGETGSGKTTIISLISGFYKIQKGEILIDGFNLNHLNLRDLRKNISVVLQDVFLFSGTIKSNITLGNPIDERTLSEAIQYSCCDSVIDSFPNGMEEPVMERGATLSAGQRQLISFARAIAHNPRIFILDEATANIDTNTEKLIQKAIENTVKNRTTLIIAHRLSTIKNADNIIVLKNGTIIEMGNHSKLLQNNGYYAELVSENSLTNKVS